MANFEKIGNNLKVYSDGRFMLSNVPCWYPTVAEAKRISEEGSAKFSISVFLDKKDFTAEIAHLENMIIEALEGDNAKGGKKKFWKSVESKKKCLIDMAELPDELDNNPALEGFFRMKLSSNENFAPDVFTADGEKPLNRRNPDDMATMQEIAENGKMVTVVGSLYAWEHRVGGYGVTVNFKGIRFKRTKSDIQFGSGGGGGTADMDWELDEEEL